MLNCKIHFSRKSERYLKNMRPQDRERIESRINQLCENPFFGVSLHGDMEGHRRIRVGDIRIIYEIKSDLKIIKIEDIGPRGDIYK